MPNKSPIFGHSHFSTDLRAESRLFLLKLWHFGGACEIQMHEAQKHRKRGGWPGMALHGRYHMNWHSLAHLESGNMSRHFLMFFMNLLIMRQKQQKLIFVFFYSGVYNKILFWSMVACPYLTVAISLFPKNCFFETTLVPSRCFSTSMGNGCNMNLLSRSCQWCQCTTKQRIP